MLRMIAAVVLSGAASLMYQVAWTRRLISETSATVTSQAIILAVFMAGLGLGSWWAAPLSRRIRRPLRGYAVVEVSAAGFAVLSIPLIGASRHLRAALDGGGMWLQLALVALFLLLPTTLLGASLPLVVEEIDRGGRPDRAVRSVGILYGANTLGAAAGCFVAGFVAIERLGLRATTLVGAALATLAAGMMMTIRASAAGIEGEARLDREEALEPRWIWWAALTGFIGLGSEVLFTRMFASVVYNTV